MTKHIMKFRADLDMLKVKPICTHCGHTEVVSNFCSGNVEEVIIASFSVSVILICPKCKEKFTMGGVY